jgi:CHAT domain-containing protein
MINMKAGMVVLSGCNTGDGIISSGEGILSLSRNFTLAGAGSIVHSLWEIQDETGVIIMDKFYENLSKGMQKNLALHKAKLHYIKNASPTMVNPYYWAGYIQSGDPAPVKSDNTWIYIAFSLIIALTGGLYIYLRKKKSLQFRK